MAISKVEFLRRFTVDEYAAVMAAAAASPAVDYYWQLLVLASDIDVANPDTVAGVTILESAGLIATGRAAEILAAPETAPPSLAEGERREWVLLHANGTPKVTVTANLALGGLTVEFTPVDWIPVSEIDGIMSIIGAAKQWLQDNGV